MNLEAVVGRVWRGAADATRVVSRSGSARPALACLGRPGRGTAAWTDATSRGHLAYRDARPVPLGAVAVICVSNRPHLLQAVADNITQQELAADTPLEVVYVANYEQPDTDAIESAFSRIESFTLEVTAPGTSLGASLNRGLELTDARFVAKFDDDDLYGPHYLADSLRAHGYCGAGVVGKHTYYAWFPERSEYVLRFPSHEFAYSSTLAGGTLVIDRDLVGDQRFDDVSLGEDRAFLAACHRRRISTFSADRFNFTQVRSSHNTWQPNLDSFMRGTRSVDIELSEHHIDR